MERPVVIKFGGASVATPDRFGQIAELLITKIAKHQQLVVVVSAMGDMTDQLVELATQVHPEPPKRELDMLVSVGERISISLLAMALGKRGYRATSFTGSQSGIITTSDHADAKIVDVRPHRLQSCLEAGDVAIVAGFQGVSENKEITTLGRGGSDTTAVALGVALGALWVEFRKDVDGMYAKDPRKDPQAERLSALDYSQAIELAEAADHAVLHPRSLRLAERNGLPLCVTTYRKMSYESEGTWIGPHQCRRAKQPCYEGSEQ